MFHSLEELYPISVPSHHFILLADTIKCDANLFLAHFLVHSLKQQEGNTLFIALDQNLNHYGMFLHFSLMFTLRCSKEKKKNNQLPSYIF